MFYSNPFFIQIPKPLKTLKTRSCPNFQDLLLLGQQQFISYGEYLIKNQHSTKKQRLTMIKYHYKNKK